MNIKGIFYKWFINNFRAKIINTIVIYWHVLDGMTSWPGVVLSVFKFVDQQLEINTEEALHR